MSAATLTTTEDQLHQTLLEGTGLRTVCGLDNDQVESFYGYGYRYYEQNKYDEAELFFATACMMNHKESRYWLGLGAARQAAGYYEEAISAYQRIVDCHQVPPIFAIRVAECFLSVGSIEEAVKTIYYAVDMADATEDPYVIEEVIDRGEVLLSIAEHRVETGQDTTA